MNQKQISSNQEKIKFHPNKISFKQTIQKIELTNFKQEKQKKRQISIRNKLRDQWLQKIKIIPPRMTTADRENFFRATDSFTQKDTDCFKMYRHNCFKKDTFQDDVELLFQKRAFQLSAPGLQASRQSAIERKSYNHTSMGFQKYRIDCLKQRKFKQNWKLAYRKDQINVLRFSTGSPKQPKFMKTAQIGKLLCEMVEAQQREQKQGTVNKIMYKKLVDFQEQQNKENIQAKVEQKKEQKEKKFRFNVKKSKTSLILKKQILF